MNKNTISAIAALVGAIIGAGVLGIPYTFAKAGVLLGLCNLVLIGTIIVLMNLMLGEITLRTKKSHMLPKLAEMFLGTKGKILMFIGVATVVWGAITAYLIGVGESIAALYGKSTFLGLNANLAFSLLFFIVVALIIYLGLRAVTRGELILASATILAIIALCIMSIPKINFSNLATLSWGNVFLPYGAVLFAVIGTSTIPEIRRILEKDKKSIKTALLIGTATPIIIYAIFAVIAVGVTGLNTTEIATIGLGNSLGPVAAIIGNLFAIFAMTSSCVVLGLVLKDSFTDGLGIKHWKAFIITMIVPLAIFLVGAKSFIRVISVTGATAGGLEGALVALIWYKARKNGGRKPEYSIKLPFAHYVLITIFSLGIIYTFLNLFGVL